MPSDLLQKAECVVVLPSVKKFAIGFGGSYGKGAMSCRSGANYDGPWSQPVMMALEGGSWGLQLGGSATDIIEPLSLDEAYLECHREQDRPTDRYYGGTQDP